MRMTDITWQGDVGRQRSLGHEWDAQPGWLKAPPSWASCGTVDVPLASYALALGEGDGGVSVEGAWGRVCAAAWAVGEMVTVAAGPGGGGPDAALLAGVAEGGMLTGGA